MAQPGISQMLGYNDHFVTDSSQDDHLTPETTSEHSTLYQELTALILFLAFNWAL